MTFPILTLATQGQCPHGGMASFIATGAKVMIQGSPVLTQGDNVLVAGCAFTVPPGKPQPCVKGLNTMPSSKVMVGGKPAILQGPADLAQSAEQIPGGPLIYSSVQMKVMAT